MYNFIGRNGDNFDAYWVIHGCPRGYKHNAEMTDPSVFRKCIDFHANPGKYFEFPSKPGEKFIKEKLPDPCGVAYTFIRTGIHEIGSDRPGSNYGAITVVLEDMDEEHTKKLEQVLKTWFEKNILEKFTYSESVGWLRWTDDAEYGLFRGEYDEQLRDSIYAVIKPFLTLTAQKSNETDDAEKMDAATRQLKEEIAKLEQTKKDIEQQLAQKYKELENM